MAHTLRKKARISAVAALLCVPIAIGSLAGCASEEDYTPAAETEGVSYTALTEVKTTDAYTANAIEKEVDYLISLDSDKLLANFYANADIQTRKTSYGGGWEDALIGGHTMGHYLSAVSQAYANASVSEEDKAELLEIIEYISGELQKCQDNAVEAGAQEGFLWGASIPVGKQDDPEFQFDVVEDPTYGGLIGEAWVPWYTMHKIVAGLLDVVKYTGNETARSVLVKLGDWVCNRTNTWDEADRAAVLNIEYGGMNDAMYNLYALTGEEKYAVAAHKFDEDVLVRERQSKGMGSLYEDILAEGSNYLLGIHANTTIPKIIGALQGYTQLQGKTVAGIDVSQYLELAEKFWDCVVERHTYVTGGNSENERFVADNSENASRDNINCETCNTYNMLKLSRMLFSLTKDVKYLDYYENTYINAILSSQNPETGMTMYFQPMGTGYFKVYSTAENSFWCCTGSGMESMSKLGDSIYYKEVLPAAEAGGAQRTAVYVAMYFSSELNWENQRIGIKQTADLENSDEVKIEVTSGATTLKLRAPDWSPVFEVSVNGTDVTTDPVNGFVAVPVKEGDTVTAKMQKTVTVHGLPDNGAALAFKYGPYVLSAELGTEGVGQIGDSGAQLTSHGVGLSVPLRADVQETYAVTGGNRAAWRENIGQYMVRGENGKFTLGGIDGTLTYSYHFRQYQQRYGIYFYFTGDDTVDVPTESRDVVESIQIGHGQYETDWLENAQNSEGTTGTRRARAGVSFTYWLAVDKSVPDGNYLVLNFSKQDNSKHIRITVGSTVIVDETLNNTTAELPVYEAVYKIPASVVQAAQDKTIAGDTKPRIALVVSSGSATATSAALRNSVSIVKIKN